MKKYMLIVLTLAILCVGLLGCIALVGNETPETDEEIISTSKKVTYVYMQASYAFFPNDLDDLEMNSDVIVLARVLPGSVNVMLTTPEERGDLGFTRTELELLQIFSGDLAVGEILTVVEPYFVVETDYEIQVRYFANYRPSTPNQEYIFFLTKYDGDFPKYIGTYNILGLHGGRFPVLSGLMTPATALDERSGVSSRSVEDFTNLELNLGHGNSTAYRRIFEEVIERYFGQIHASN